jgi:TIR domain/Protein of unknown function (DUF1566)
MRAVKDVEQPLVGDGEVTMIDVFLSYAREDRERAGQLAAALEVCGWSVWWDRKIIAGQAFDQVIEQQLEAARCVVVLWSKHSVSSEWVRNEAAAAAERGVLVPALIDEIRLPLEFRRRQTVSLVGWDGDQEDRAFTELCHHVTARIKGTVLPEPAPNRPSIFRWRSPWVLGSVSVVIVPLALGAYLASSWQRRQHPPIVDTQQAPATNAISSAPPADPKGRGETERARVGTLRRVAATLSGDMVKALLQNRGFYDKRWNPGGKGVIHEYAGQIRSGTAVLLDGATGLTWQKGGSGPMTFADAEQYVRRLNSERVGGFDDWRLPTVEEALSLMEPQTHEDRHIDPAFERDASFIWTADHTTDQRLWVVYFYDGIVTAERDLFNAWVRAVR